MNIFNLPFKTIVNIHNLRTVLSKMLLRNSIHASGFNSTPSNYRNSLTHERIKSLTSYGTTLTNSRADPLTPKPSMRYFMTGDGGAMKHARHHLKTHPAEIVSGDGKSSRRRRHRRRREKYGGGGGGQGGGGGAGSNPFYDNDFYDVDHPRSTNGQPRKFNPKDPLDAPIAPQSHGSKHSLARFRNGKKFAKFHPSKALGFRRKIFYSSRVV